MFLPDPMITRADAFPCIERIIVKVADGTILSMKTEKITNRKYRRYLTWQQEGNSDLKLVARSSERINKLLVTYDRKLREKESILEEIRRSHGVSAFPRNEATNEYEKDFFIDVFMNDHPEYVDAVMECFHEQTDLVINRNYEEEVMAAVIYALLGLNAIDFEMILDTFIAGFILKLLDGNNKNDLPQHLAAFADRLKSRIQHELAIDAQGFRNKLVFLLENDRVASRYVIFLPPKIYLMQIMDENGQLQDEYLGISSSVDSKDFAYVLGMLDIGEKKQGGGIETSCFSDSAPFLTSEAQNMRGDLLWFNLPQGKIGPKNIRALYTNFNHFRIGHWGQRLDNRRSKLDELLMIEMIEFNGLYGVTKLTAADIIRNERTIISENAISQMNKRNKHLVNIETLKLFSHQE